MKLMKTTLAICLLVSGSVLAQETTAETNATTQLQNIIDSSRVLRGKLDTAYQGVYGMEDLSHYGQTIPQKDALQGGMITWEEAQAFNMSIEEYKYYRIQSAIDQLVEETAWDADMAMHQAVDNFVDASVAVLETVKVGEMAEQAQANGDVESAENVQAYVTENFDTVQLTESEVDTYNETLQVVNDSVAQFAALSIVASDEGMRAELQSQAEAFGAEVADVSNIFFDNVDNKVAVEFSMVNENQETVIQYATVDVSAYLSIDNMEFFDAGLNNPMYNQGPTQNVSCLLNATDLNMCTGRGRSGPPPNTLLYGDYDGDGIMEPMAYTDENGNITDYVAGDEVYHPETGEYVGRWDENFVFVCDGNTGYCTI